jgi:hypothetical protein
MKTKTKRTVKNRLIAALENQTNTALTTNGAVTNKTTKSSVLDFFAVGAALRAQSESEIFHLFSSAYSEDKLLSLKAAFYFRDIRAGQGERRLFRTILKWLVDNDSVSLEQNLQHVPLFGRWDDLFVLFGTSLESKVLSLIKEQWDKDADVEKPTIMAKWLSSPNASSKQTRMEAGIIRRALGLSEKEFRQSLSLLRSRIGVVEQQMCAGDWDKVNYSHVPSRAGMLYRKAFSKHDADRYVKYLADVKSGKAKINASTLYPYDIVQKICAGADATLEAQWNALPNYMEGNQRNGLVVADVSGSMNNGHSSVRPIDVSISLAIYIAERNAGPFQNYFLTFSAEPKLVKLKGSTLQTKVANLSRADWGMNTNIQATFDLILSEAAKHKIKQKDMPEFVLIVSDMEFDACGQDTNFDTIKRKYQRLGYTVPQLIFWNVNGRADNNPVTMDENGTALVSGASPSILKSVLSGRWETPYQLMCETLLNNRYDVITVSREETTPVKRAVRAAVVKKRTKLRKVVKSKKAY